MIAWRRGALVLLLWMVAFCCRGEGFAVDDPAAQAAWKAGNEAFAAGNYEAAAGQYAAVTQRQPASAVAWYNLGNALYRNRRTGPAILAYEKALLRKPGMEEAEHNLRVVRGQLPGQFGPAEKPRYLGWLRSLASPANSDTWALMAISFFVALMAVVAFRRSAVTFPHMGLVVPLALLWAASLGLSYASLRAGKSVHAVVMKPASMRFNGETEKTDLPEGVTVRLVEPGHSGMAVVQLPDGRHGQLPAAVISVIN